MLGAALFVTTLFLLGTPFVGFDAFLTASIDLLFAFTAIIVLNKSPSAYSARFLDRMGDSFSLPVSHCGAWNYRSVASLERLSSCWCSPSKALCSGYGDVLVELSGDLARSERRCIGWEQALSAPYNGKREAASIVASALHTAIFVVQSVVTWIVARSREDLIDTYAGQFGINCTRCVRLF